MTEKIAPLSGFPELLPADQLAESRMIDQLRRVFELHGFTPVETRSVEPLTQLARKGEIDKEVYVLRRLHAEPTSGAAEDDTSGNALGLHYDLTVPFARYILENAGKLHFPFRRYQIQKVWRGERPQEGRYREFTQADIDVVNRDQLPFHHDVEIARVMAAALSTLPVPPLRLQVNNRKLLEGFFRGLEISDIAAVMRTVDKLDKVPRDVIHTTLTEEIQLSERQAQLCLELAEITTSDLSFAARVRDLGVNHHLLDEGLDELAEVLAGCQSLNNDRLVVRADLRIARGLDYYTGTVFETRMKGFESLGSICSGGRYDSLATDGNISYPGVGISLGLTRLLTPLFTRRKLTGSRSVPSVVLVAVPAETERQYCDKIADSLRKRGVACEVSPTAAKYGKQIRFADRRGIPFLWFPGTAGAADEVKDIRTGEQQPADATSWLPPAEDLLPDVVSVDQAINDR